MGGGNIIASADDLARFARAVGRGDFFSPRVLALLRTRPTIGSVQGSMSFGWFVRKKGDRPARLFITGSNPGVQTALYVYPDDDLVVVVLSNTWGRDARSAEMVIGLPDRLVTLCTGWPQTLTPYTSYCASSRRHRRGGRARSVASIPLDRLVVRA